MASAKALALAQELRSSLVQRSTGLALGALLLDGADNNNPYLIVGTGAAGSQSMLIKLKEFTPVGNTIIGQPYGVTSGVGTAVGYAQSIIQVVLETSTIANVSLMLESNKLPLLGELLQRGTRVELYMTANTTAVALAGITGGNLKATFDANAQYRLLAQQ